MLKDLVLHRRQSEFIFSRVAFGQSVSFTGYKDLLLQLEPSYLRSDLGIQFI